MKTRVAKVVIWFETRRMQSWFTLDHLHATLALCWGRTNILAKESFVVGV